MALPGRGRWAWIALLVAFLAAGAVVAAWVWRDDPSGPSSTPSAAAWGDGAVNLPSRTGVAADRLCRPALEQAGVDVPEQHRALASDQRGDRILALYRGAASYGVCSLEGEGAEDLVVLSAVAGPTTPPSGEHVVPLALTADDSPTAGAVALSFDVRRVTVTAAEEELEAFAADGFAVFWFPASLPGEGAEDVVVTAYDVHDTPLYRGSPF